MECCWWYRTTAGTRVYCCACIRSWQLQSNEFDERCCYFAPGYSSTIRSISNNNNSLFASSAICWTKVKKYWFKDVLRRTFIRIWFLRCWVSGWGKNDFVSGIYQTIQKEVDIPILPTATCQTSLAATRLGASFLFDTTSFICAGGEAGKDACTVSCKIAFKIWLNSIKIKIFVVSGWRRFTISLWFEWKMVCRWIGCMGNWVCRLKYTRCLCEHCVISTIHTNKHRNSINFRIYSLLQYVMKKIYFYCFSFFKSTIIIYIFSLTSMIVFDWEINNIF